MKRLTVYIAILFLFSIWPFAVVYSNVSVSAGRDYTVGLKSDGTVIWAGWDDSGPQSMGKWNDIIQVSAGLDHIVGLKSNGKVISVGANIYNQRSNLDLWRQIMQVAAGTTHTVGLANNGTCGAVGAAGVNDKGQTNVSGWSGIVQVEAGSSHTLGLRSSGTVVATGNNESGQCNVSGWSGIVQISAGVSHTIGLKGDGTVVAVGDNTHDQLNIDSWSNIIQVAAGWDHTLGLRSDGTVVSTGENDEGQCNVSGWSGIAQVAAGYSHTVGLISDGTVVAVGWNRDGQTNVSEWVLETTNDCYIEITPSSISSVDSGDSIHFSVINTGSGCFNRTYQWSLSTSIGSVVDGLGNYIAGRNTTGSSVVDVIEVYDHANDISDEVSVTVLVTSGCPLVNIYGYDSKNIELLRYIRGNILSQTPEGREIIRLYYQWSPAIVKTMEEDEGFKEGVKEMIDGVMPLIKEEVE